MPWIKSKSRDENVTDYLDGLCQGSNDLFYKKASTILVSGIALIMLLPKQPSWFTTIDTAPHRDLRIGVHL